MADHSSDTLSHDNVSQSVASGFSWQGFALIGKQAFQFILLVILARLLTPRDFGLIALILVITDFLALFNGERGFSDAIIQRKELQPRHLFSVFWLNILIGLFIGAGVLVSAPLIAQFLGEPRLVPIASVLAFNFPVYALRTVPISLLMRRMNFRILSIIDLLSFAFGGVVAIILAYMGFGVWSLVFQSIVTMFLAVSALWFVIDWRPKFSFDYRSFRELWDFSRNMIGFYVWDYWILRGDNLLIGKLLGSVSLGYYTRAYMNAFIPYQFAGVSRRIMRSALSIRQDDRDQVRSLYLEALTYITMFSAPILFGLIATADNFVLAVYGEKWLPMITTMQWLCIVGFFLTIGSTVDSIFQSQNRTDLLFQWGIIRGAGIFSSFLIGIWIGTIEAVAMSHALVLILLSYWNFTIPGRLVDFSYIDVVRIVGRYVIYSLAMALCVYGLNFLMEDIQASIQLPIQVLSGAIFYAMLLVIFERNRMMFLLAMLNRFLALQPTS